MSVGSDGVSPDAGHFKMGAQGGRVLAIYPDTRKKVFPVAQLDNGSIPGRLYRPKSRRHQPFAGSDDLETSCRSSRSVVALTGAVGRIAKN